MTDQHAFELAGWIERARKAEAALRAHGFQQGIKDGPWKQRDPRWTDQAGLTPRSAWDSGVLTQPSTPPSPPAKPNGYVYPPKGEPAGWGHVFGVKFPFPPIDYDTKS